MNQNISKFNSDKSTLFYRKYKKLMFGVLLGGFSGFLYWYYIGCSSGSCAITSNPLNSSLYGMLIGGILFYPKKTKA